MLNLPFVQLQDQPAICVQAFVVIPAMTTDEAEKFLTPATAGLNITHTLTEQAALNSLSVIDGGFIQVVATSNSSALFGGRRPSVLPAK